MLGLDHRQKERSREIKAASAALDARAANA